MNTPESCIKASVLIESAIKVFIHLPSIIISLQYRSILHRLDSGRIYIYRLYYSFGFTFASNLCFGILFLLPFFEFPSSLTISSDVRHTFIRPEIPCGLLQAIEFICLTVFLVRALMLVSCEFACISYR